MPLANKQIIEQSKIIENIVLNYETLSDEEKKVQPSDSPLIKKLKMNFKSHPQMIDKETQTDLTGKDIEEMEVKMKAMTDNLTTFKKRMIDLDKNLLLDKDEKTVEITNQLKTKEEEFNNLKINEIGELEGRIKFLEEKQLNSDEKAVLDQLKKVIELFLSTRDNSKEELEKAIKVYHIETDKLMNLWDEDKTPKLIPLISKSQLGNSLNKWMQLIYEQNNLVGKLENTENVLARLEKSNREFKIQYEETNKLLQISQNEKDILRNQKKEFENRVDEFDIKIKDLEKLLDSKKAEFETLRKEKENILDQLNQKEEELRNKVTESEREKQTDLQKIEELEEKIRKLDTDKLTDDERKILQTIRNLINHLKSFSPSSYSPTLNTLNSQRTSLSCPNLSDIPTELVSLGNNITSRLNSFETEKRNLNSQISTLNNEISRNNSNWQSERSNLNSQISSLNSQLSNVRYEANRASGLQSQVYSLQSENRELSNKSIDNYSSIPIAIITEIQLQKTYDWSNNKYALIQFYINKSGMQPNTTKKLYSSNTSKMTVFGEIYYVIKRSYVEKLEENNDL